MCLLKIIRARSEDEHRGMIGPAKESLVLPLLSMTLSRSNDGNASIRVCVKYIYSFGSFSLTIRVID